MGRLIASLLVAVAAAAACDQASREGTAAASPPPTEIATASVLNPPSASAVASARPADKQIGLQIIAPGTGAKAGVNGIGWTVDLIAKGTGPAMEKIKPGIRGGGATGRHPNFPGLVVLLKSLSAGGQAENPNTNLAGLFQIIGLPDTLGPLAGISAARTAASPVARPIASIEDETAHATWFVDQTLWGNDIDVELTAFVVDGEAPDKVSDRGALKIVSNEVVVRFHINGSTTLPFGSARPSPSP